MAANPEATSTEANVDQTAAPKQKYDFTKLNTLSLVAIGFSVIGGTLPAIVFGHISLAQIKKNPQDGRVLAIIALVLGYLQVAVWVIGGIITIGMIIVSLTQGVPLSGLEQYMNMNGWGGPMGGRSMMGWDNN